MWSRGGVRVVVKGGGREGEKKLHYMAMVLKDSLNWVGHVHRERFSLKSSAFCFISITHIDPSVRLEVRTPNRVEKWSRFPIQNLPLVNIFQIFISTCLNSYP